MSKIQKNRIYSEQSLLSLILDNPDIATDAVTYVKPEQFYSPVNREIFEVISGIVLDGLEVETTTVYHRLKTKNSDIGMTQLLDILGIVVNPKNASEYFNSVHHYSELVDMMEYAQDLLKDVDRSENTCYDLVKEYTEKFFRLDIGAVQKSVVSISEAMADVERSAAVAYANGGEVGLKTGFPTFDKYTLGLQDGYFIVLAGRPSIGKTALALNWAEHICMNRKVPGLFISLEMSSEQLSGRLLSSKLDISTYKLRTGKMKKDEWDRFNDSHKKYESAPLYIADTPGITIPQMIATIRQAVKMRGVKVVFIDYLQLISATGRSRNEEIMQISASIKNAAREFMIPIVALSQLNRNADGRMPTKADLRDSGTLEQDADLVILLYRPKKANGMLDNEGVIIIDKARNESTGIIDVVFNPERTNFREKDVNHGINSEIETETTAEDSSQNRY